MYKYDLDSMKKGGFTERFAKQYLNLMNFERNSGYWTEEIIREAYSTGFYANHYYSYTQNGTKQIDTDQYLTDYDYDRLWPLNDWMRIWVNDKLTLKYMLAHTEFDDVMPKYYFYQSRNGLRKLIDNDNDDQSLDAFVALLKQVGEFACKTSNGQEAVGFVKMTYEDDCFYINDKICDEASIRNFVESHPNYLYTEYLHPVQELASICPKIPTIRVMVLNEDGNHPILIPSCYIRFGTSRLGDGNYVRLTDRREDSCLIFADVNTHDGTFGNAMAFFPNKTQSIVFHPDTNAKILGEIPSWNIICNKALGISKMLFGVEWIGFDLCVDVNGGVKLMEINTQPGIGYLQTYRPLLTIPEVKSYFERKQMDLKRLDTNGLHLKNEIVR